MPPSAWPRRSTVRGASNPWRWARWPDGSDTMRMPSFARRHPWIGLLIVVTIGVASWMLQLAPHPATEPVSLAAVGSEASKPAGPPWLDRSEEHTHELQSLMRISYAVFCLKKQT